MKKDIENRADVSKLVVAFYEKIKQDQVLGPIFNGMILNWDAHLEHLTTFWESSLFISKKLEHRYVGNPLDVHVNVDAYTNHAINEMHFGIWLNYWSQTVDLLYCGENAEMAKRRARKMATFIHIKMFEAR